MLTLKDLTTRDGANCYCQETRGQGSTDLMLVDVEDDDERLGIDMSVIMLPEEYKGIIDEFKALLKDDSALPMYVSDWIDYPIDGDYIPDNHTQYRIWS